MPNIGKPSGGCHACRRMRVKCDERKPGCSRCERGGRDCPGYRDDSQIFHSMNEASETLALFPRRRRKPKSANVSPHSAPVREKERHRSQSPPRPASTSGVSPLSIVPEPMRQSSDSHLRSGDEIVASLTASMSTNWDDVALGYYFKHFVISPGTNGETIGFFECLPALLSENVGLRHLEEALKSVTLSAFGNLSCMEQLKLQARRSYGEALSQVNSALNDFTTAKADATLATLIMLGQYEIISGDRPGRSLWMSHGEGQATLLGLRGAETLLDERSRQLFYVAQVGLQLSGVAAHSSRKPWRSKPPPNLFSSTLSRRLHDFNEVAFETRREIAVLLRDEWRDEEWHERLRIVALRQQVLLDEGEQIVTYCQEQGMFWLADNITNTERLQTEAGTRDVTPSPLPSYVYLFSEIMTATNLLYFWAIRTKLLDGLLTSIGLLETANYALPPLVHSTQLRAQLYASTDDMLAALPFAMNELDATGALTIADSRTCVGAYHALWPLHVLCSLRDLDPSRRDWVLAQLEQISAGFGIRQAALLRAFWIQRALVATPQEAALEHEANAGPGSIWFPIL